ncbi:H-type lectin domain-containing protein [Sedimentitalea sp. HM32M-2]|uniref:H-type lectin domain-containing protein n=1 Tax=Sedimentitalea sp. HM32M-2 TaxID=3351566 RepID=UPI0036411E8E
MKRIETHLIGIEQGEVALFSEFQDGGAMWTGEGRRERSQTVRFSEAFLAAPAVQLAVSLWDVDTSAPIRAELAAQNVTPEGVEIVFRT